MKLIERPQYMEKMISVMGTPDIKVITGVRRSGKSKLLEMFKAHIENHLPNANIIHINFNLPEYDEYLNYKALYDHIKAQYKPGTENYVLIDEVQMCDGFEKAINGLHGRSGADRWVCDD